MVHTHGSLTASVNLENGLSRCAGGNTQDCAEEDEFMSTLAVEIYEFIKRYQRPATLACEIVSGAGETAGPASAVTATASFRRGMQCCILDVSVI